MRAALYKFLLVGTLIQSTVNSVSSFPEAEKPEKGGKLMYRRTVPQAENSGKRNPWTEIFESQVEQDQDACNWRCDELCAKRCETTVSEGCLEWCARKHGWKDTCLSKCEQGLFDKPGGWNWTEEEQEEEEEDEEKR